jgi:preprotein translocase subunit SecA
MTDIHSSIARLLFRARLEVTPMPAMPQMPLMYTGPDLDSGDGPRAEDTSTGPAQRPAEPDRAAGLGINPRMAVRPPTPPVDPKRLATNRDDAGPTPPASSTPEVGRNDPCPCGSGKKYKKCHGAGMQ